MANPADLRHDVLARTRDRVVRPLSRAAARPCSRPGCPTPASATLSFRYGTREAWLETLSDEREPENYDLCGTHADRTRPPHGWDLIDERPAEASAAVVAGPPADLGSERTVAVLAAALRAVPDGRPTEPVADDPVSPAIEAAAGAVPGRHTSVVDEASERDEAPAEDVAPEAELDTDDLQEVLEELAAFEAEVAAATEVEAEAAPVDGSAPEVASASVADGVDGSLQLALEAIDQLGETGRAERW